MGVLSENARKGLRRINRRPDLPDWWPVMQSAILVLFAGVMIFQFLQNVGSSPAELRAEREVEQIEEITGSIPEGFVPLDEINAQDTTPGAEQPELPLGDSGATRRLAIVGNTTAAVDVPEQAVLVAELAAVALFTGDTSKVPVVSGTAMVVVGGTGGEAEVLGLNAIAVEPDRIVLSVTVSLGAAIPARDVAVTLLLEPSGWRYLPD